MTLEMYKVNHENYVEKIAVAYGYDRSASKYVFDILYNDPNSGTFIKRSISFGKKVDFKHLKVDPMKLYIPDSLRRKPNRELYVFYRIEEYKCDRYSFSLWYVDNVGLFITFKGKYLNQIKKDLSLGDPKILTKLNLTSFYYVVEKEIASVNNVFLYTFRKFLKLCFFALKGRVETEESLMNT